MTDSKHRLLTRSDFDGLVCAVLLKHLDLIDEVRFAHPKDVQDGEVEITNRDILTNLPYAPGCHLCFDHHGSEEERLEDTIAPNLILDASADSAAEVVMNYFGGRSRFAGINFDMIDAVNKADSARFTREEVLEAEGWPLLSFIMDPRTGLGRFREFRISNYELMMQLIGYCHDHNIDEILALPDVAERIELYREHTDRMKQQILRCSTTHENLVVLDLRAEETIWAGNRFIVYALHPNCNVSMHVLWGREKKNTVFAMGKSIFDRTCPVDIGALALQFGGGGHPAAGTCQVANDDAERVRQELATHLIGRASGERRSAA